ncbi:hypothetical protein [Bradyrhizobium mercantei]|uniref:hypothetical protein n=1 Tax=Bradyrhizobium mercantei TaxID=1904807 RepID=UPI0011784327|nr:hypothetical protein [Bradyrhizobium mercantei]
MIGRDIVVRDGIVMMRIRAENNKTREFREVPLHSHIIEQGLLDYVKSRGTRPLFYDPARSRGGKDSNPHHKKVGERLAKWGPLARDRRARRAQPRLAPSFFDGVPLRRDAGGRPQHHPGARRDEGRRQLRRHLAAGCAARNREIAALCGLRSNTMTNVVYAKFAGAEFAATKSATYTMSIENDAGEEEIVAHGISAGTGAHARDRARRRRQGGPPPAGRRTRPLLLDRTGTGRRQRLRMLEVRLRALAALFRTRRGARAAHVRTAAAREHGRLLARARRDRRRVRRSASVRLGEGAMEKTYTLLLDRGNHEEVVARGVNILRAFMIALEHDGCRDSRNGSKAKPCRSRILDRNSASALGREETVVSAGIARRWLHHR